MLRCGCEEGRDCTKTTVCAVENALENEREANWWKIREAFVAGYEAGFEGPYDEYDPDGEFDKFIGSRP